jgi:uncharacterized membrane protein YtjA (UPF0391 family)
VARSTGLMLAVVCFLLLTAFTGILGYSRLSKVSATIAKVLFYIFLVIFLVVVFSVLYVVMPLPFAH